MEYRADRRALMSQMGIDPWLTGRFLMNSSAVVIETRIYVFCRFVG